MTDLRCHSSLEKTLGLLLLCVVMLVAAGYCTTVLDPVAKVAGWCGLGFFPLGLYTYVRRALIRHALVVFDDVGIHDHMGFGTIPWDEIKSVGIAQVYSSRFLCVEVAQPNRFVDRLPVYRRVFARANPALGYPPITIALQGLSPGLDEAWAYIQSHHPDKVWT